MKKAKKVAPSILAAVVGLIAGVLGSEAVHKHTERAVAAAMDYVAVTLERAARQRASAGTVELQPIDSRGPSKPGPVRADVDRIVDLANKVGPRPIELVDGSFSSPAVKVARFVQKADGRGGNELLELEALRPIDLSDARIGDSKRAPGSSEALRLPKDLRLEPSERIRIFTTVDFETGRKVELRQSKGIWTASPGEKDRVWMTTADGTQVLDFWYRVQ